MRIFILLIVVVLISGCVTSKRVAPTVSPLDSVVENRSEKILPSPVQPATEQKPLEPPKTEPSVPLQPERTNAVVQKSDKWISIDSVASSSWKIVYSNQVYPKKCVITCENRRLEIVEDTQICKFDGITVYLGHSPRWENGKCMVKSADFVSTIQPLVEAKPIFNSNKPIVVVDAGHGGNDPGALSVVNGKPEKDYTLDIARRLASALNSYGFGVAMTRANDTRVERSARVSVAQKVNAHAFVSIHLNYFDKSVKVQGVETYCLTPSGLPSTLNRGFVDNVAANYPNNAFDNANILLAAEIHKSIVGKVKCVDRGVRRARFIEVLQNQKCPAVLVEACYLSSPNEAVMIEKSEYRQAIAEAIADGLKKLYNPMD